MWKENNREKFNAYMREYRKNNAVRLAERNKDYEAVFFLKPYILALKERDLNGLRCENCGITDVPLDIHHKKYGAGVTYYDLILLCEHCHCDLKKPIQTSTY